MAVRVLCNRDNWAFVNGVELEQSEPVVELEDDHGDVMRIALEWDIGAAFGSGEMRFVVSVAQSTAPSWPVRFDGNGKELWVDVDAPDDVQVRVRDSDAATFEPLDLARGKAQP